MEQSLARTNATVLVVLLLGALLGSSGRPLASKPPSPRAPDVATRIPIESYSPLTDQSQWTYRVQQKDHLQGRDVDADVPLRVARDAQHAEAVGTYGAIASTSDGVNWTWNQATGNSPLYDIRALPDGDYLVVGASGTVLRGNPASGWKQTEMPAGVCTWISASEFNGARHGVAGGGHGLLLTTGDFEKKWEWKANG